jgi:hypothetical protein
MKVDWGTLTRMGEMRNAYEILFERPETRDDLAQMGG